MLTSVSSLSLKGLIKEKFIERTLLLKKDFPEQSLSEETNEINEK